MPFGLRGNPGRYDNLDYDNDNDNGMDMFNLSVNRS